MARIAILDRADMNAEQARVYDVAKQSSGIVGGPYYAYIRLPKLFEACQEPEGLFVIGTVVAPRATDCESCRRAALECSISVVRAGSPLARRWH
jgi:hypothetical protein